MLVIGMLTWPGIARLVRGQFLSFREQQFVLAARSIGVPPAQIMFRHLLPNCVPPLIVVATVQIAQAIALEATLSFLGVGVPITEPSLGLLISMLHMNDVTNVFNVIRHWDSSWLSREILFGVAFAGIAARNRALRRVIASAQAADLPGVFKADAVIHVGKHGSLEWLPDKALGLSGSAPEPDV